MTHASPQADLLANIDYLAPHGAPDNDRKAKESSWLVSQAFIEGLRYYPTGQVALDGNDCEATYSGNTHHKGSSVFEHMETDLRSRLVLPRPRWSGARISSRGSGCRRSARR